MVIKPLANKPQIQSITTALKNICREYPAGGAILRELLQNADDAGASTVKFVLDDKSYEAEPLLHPELAQYQGPALLAFNSAKFLDRDFESLSQVGDSLKFSDGSTTGRFGRGFNSVYNWTDSPSIVSRDRLLILDPHHVCSSGGEIYDFVSNAAAPEMRIHMSVFQELLEHLDQSLDGTIIRIPMRTNAQAQISKISDRQTTVAEMAMVLKKFADEFSNGGLVFMKHVARISIFSKITGAIEIELCNFEEVLLHKNMVNDAIINFLNDTSYTFNHTFELATQYTSCGETTKTSFMVNHNISGQSMSQELLEWSESQKFAPWVAIAITLSGGSEASRTGSLFTVMPLQIQINQPALIHGLFSISPDRKKLYNSQDSSSQDELPAKWNEWLFNESISNAWVKLLCHLASSSSAKSSWEHWPNKVTDTNCFSKNVLAKVLSLIRQENLPLFHTHIGYVAASAGILATGSESEELKAALLAAKIPVFFVPNLLRSDIDHMFPNGRLEPQTLCQFLDGKNQWVIAWNDDTRQAILEYILLVLASSDHGKTLELLPFEDGQRRSLDARAAFVHRDDFEADLFRRDVQHNLDMSRFSMTAVDALKDSLLMTHDHAHIRFRSTKDLNSYALTYEFQHLDQNSDVVDLNLDQIAFVTKVWSWMSYRELDIFNEQFGPLWLFPISKGRYRKVRPLDCWVLFPPSGGMGDIIQRLGEFGDITRAKPVLLISTLRLEQTSLSLLKTVKAEANLQVHNGEMFHFLVQWLAQFHLAIENASDEVKTAIVKHIAKALEGANALSYMNNNLLSLPKLPIFRGLLTCENDKDLRHPWVRIEKSKSVIGVIDKTIHLPPFRDYQFLDAQTKSMQKILDFQNIPVCKEIRLVEDHIIPAWKGLQKCVWSPSSKAQTAELMLQSYYEMSTQAQTSMIKLPIVPTQYIDGGLTGKFSVAADLVDPEINGLKDVFFGDEYVLPAAEQYKRYGSIFRILGLRTKLDESFIYERTLKFANTSHSTEEVHLRASNLLKAPCSWSTSEATGPRYKQFLNTKWLPATSPDGNTVMASPNQCRGIEDRLRVGYRLPIVSLLVSYGWKEFLGWEKTLSDDVLLAQLTQGIIKEDRAVLNVVLTHIKENSRISAVSESLTHLRCVLTENGKFVTASKAFFSGCTHLDPFLSNIEKEFAKNHKDILTAMNIRSKPGVKDILNIQAQVEGSGHPYKESDIEVLLETIKVASSFSRETLQGLKVLDQDGTLCPVEDIAFDDAAVWSGRLVDKVRFTNSRISKEIAQKLRIEFISERWEKGKLQMADDDDDEEDFEQCEAITTSISTTLQRYRIESTFKEYLANADDAEASAIHWMLDSRQHPTDTLITKEVKDLQGPALLVHNDKTFQEADFKGFKNVGLGSKREDKSTIGMFGRGSQTMFHFTDNPILLSGSYLLILDPLQKSLPFNNKRQARKPGVKIPLSILRHKNPDQLAPFQDLWGYNCNSDYYDGTIFRFPFRKHASPLNNNQYPEGIDSVRLLLKNYFEEARISLLFLKNVKTVNFKGPGAKETFWSVKMKQEKRKNPTTPGYRVFVAKQIVGQNLVATEDKWWVYSKTETSSTVPEIEHQSRAQKHIGYGIAALIPLENQQHLHARNLPKSKIFNSLPLPEDSNLPVHIHGTFYLSGDRNTLITGDGSPESKWNEGLLKGQLTDAYFTFLEDLAQEVGADAFKFWPRRHPSGGSRLELLCKSFWENLPKSSARLFTRRVPNGLNNMTFAECVFEDLLPNFSKQIAPVLQVLVPNLSSYLDAHILDHLEPKESTINRPGLRKLFKSEAASKCLQNAMVDHPLLIGSVLSEVIPVGDVSSDELGELDGCRLLPLANGTLGQLTQVHSRMTPSTQCYYIVTKSELDLFDFAKSRLILENQNTSYDRIDEITRTEKFNVMRLSIFHIPELLSIKSQGSRIVSEETDKWLKSFWSYWNKLSTSATEDLSKNPDSFHSLPLFKAKRDRVWGYHTMSELNDLPSVIDPSAMAHKHLCSCIHGLYRFRPELMPKSIADAEKSLNDAKAFKRLAGALQSLGPNKATIENLFAQLVTRHDPSKSGRKDIIKLFQELVIGYVNAGHESAPNYLSFLPIWPACMPSNLKDKYIPASCAKYTMQPQLLVPWTKRLLNLIDFNAIDHYGAEACLKVMGVTSIAAESLLQSFAPDDFVSTLQETSEGVYIRFIDTLEVIALRMKTDYSFIAKLSSLPIAADTNGRMRRPLELFNHNDEIFQAAFQDGGGHFLHNCVRKYNQLWFNVGLRRRESNNCFKVKDYEKCLVSLVDLIKSESYGTLVDPTLSLQGRMQKILSPLITPSSATHQFSEVNWNSLSDKEVFLVRRDNSREPSYRRKNMDRVSSFSPAVSLSDVVLHKYAAICWSNTPFVVLEPTTEILSKVSRHGEPSMTEVWKHLEHMVEISKTILRADIPEFLSDLFEIYEYLHQNLVRSGASFRDHGPTLKQKSLWLNLEIPDPTTVTLKDLRLSWKPINHLLLISSTDAPPLECIRSSLSPYVKLLKELGCESIHHPKIERPAPLLGRSLLHMLRVCRKNNEMTDIVLIAENIRFPAHKVILACASDKMRRQLSGDWADNGEIIVEEIKPDVLEFLIGQAYEEPIDWEKMDVNPDETPQDSDANDKKLELLLNLHRGADYWLMKSLANEIETKILDHAKSFVRLDNVSNFQENARYSRAILFEEFCKEFCEKNNAALKRLEDAIASQHMED
ncbi:hypothetical protein BPAE_0132g00110 [Botrytis paeoniae]|uniref:BTB domain-containing protein n=1 Tax=Botrytis paeoniae TaxID=278948 RepID=A0A4Z1FP97_9HELO|nr:hypothetical protein BPAE_0132g00110 [Botrytis paeoniae]